MPEGPEVESVRRSLEPLVVGRVLGRPWVSALSLRTPVTRRQLSFVEGRRVSGLGRQGKLLWLSLEGGAGLMVRLGMTGKLLVQERPVARRPHTHVVVPLDDGERELRYVDVRRFGSVVPFAGEEALSHERARLGPDPLSWSDEERARFTTRLKGTKRSLKDALLDQSLVAGVGNIYACEALFLAGLSPLAQAASVPRWALEQLAVVVGEVLAKAVALNGTTFSDFMDANGERGDYFSQVLVFQREGEPCPRCSRAVERIVQGGRSTFLCRRCQPARARRPRGAP